LKRFAQLFTALDTSTATNAKVAALEAYFRAAPAADAAWATYFLAGGKPQQMVPSKVLRQAALAATGLPDWLFEESYQAVGDIAETIAHALPPPGVPSNIALADWLDVHLRPLRGQAPDAVAAQLATFWSGLDATERFLLNKLITGGFRVGVSKLLVIRALSQATGIDTKVLTQRMMGYTDRQHQPSAASFTALTDTSASAAQAQQSGQPYPFFLAHAWLTSIDDEARFLSELGSCDAWHVEWKWDGIRAQLVKRQGAWWLWSRGEELITDKFPELALLAAQLPDGTVLDGEVLAWDEAQHKPLPFAKLQQRITRKTVGAKLLKDVPTTLLAYDVLAWDGADVRTQTHAQRHALLQTLAAQAPLLRMSPTVTASSWRALHTLRAESRARGVEGFMLKAKDSRYGVGRTKADGVWWKWKIDPLSIDCVLIYAQRGHGRRASLYTDYTFAVWDGDTLVPFAKAYSGLTDAEIKRVDAVIQKTTVEKFGPVRSVTPTLVFELGFEGIQASPRHKSGIAVRFPRILRWREDKTIQDADTLQTLTSLLTAA
jgi:DNA ligase 1